MKNVFDKSCRGNQNIHFVSNNFFPPKVKPFMRYWWKDIVEWGSPQMTVWHMRIACWIPTATNTHSQYVILAAFPLQQGCKNALPCYVIHKLLVLFWLSKDLRASQEGLHGVS